MPFVRITLNHELPQYQREALAVDIRDIMASELHKKLELTAVLVEKAAGSWIIGQDFTHPSAHIEANITAGTNTAAEKAAFIKAAMESLNRYISKLAATTYIIVREIPATDWGYDGRTQASRR